jgi:hypothetical protein
MITDSHLKIKLLFQEQKRLVIILCLGIIFMSLASFCLGILMGIQIEKDTQGITVEYPPYLEPISAKIGDTSPNTASSQLSTGSTVNQGIYVASKSGTRYYLPTCSGVSRIKEENKIWFQTKEQAEARGLLPAANCPGL